MEETEQGSSCGPTRCITKSTPGNHANWYVKWPLVSKRGFSIGIWLISSQLKVTELYCEIPCNLGQEHSWTVSYMDSVTDRYSKSPVTHTTIILIVIKFIIYPELLKDSKVAEDLRSRSNQLVNCGTTYSAAIKIIIIRTIMLNLDMTFCVADQ